MEEQDEMNNPATAPPIEEEEEDEVEESKEAPQVAASAEAGARAGQLYGWGLNHNNQVSNTSKLG